MADPIIEKPAFPPRLAVIRASFARKFWLRLRGSEPEIMSIIHPTEGGTADLVGVVWGGDLHDGRATAEKLRLAYNAHDELIRLLEATAERLEETRAGPAEADASLVEEARRLIAALRAGIPVGVVQDETPIEMPAEVSP